MGYAVTITVVAAGPLAKLQAFLDQVQRIQPRAMLVFNVSFSPNEGGDPITGSSAQLTLSAQVFVAMQDEVSLLQRRTAGLVAGLERELEAEKADNARLRLELAERGSS